MTYMNSKGLRSPAIPNITKVYRSVTRFIYAILIVIIIITSAIFNALKEDNDSGGYYDRSYKPRSWYLHVSFFSFAPKKIGNVYKHHPCRKSFNEKRGLIGDSLK